MTKRTLAALAALLAFMAVLVAVPLATSDTAEAHTKTVKRCSYDPFTNQNQCWTETVAHTHRVIPDNPPPDTSPTTTAAPTTTTTAPPPKTCPPGQHSNGGAGKNCHSHSFTPPCGTGTWSPGHGHTPIQKPPCPTTPPTTTTTTEPPKCPAGQVGTPPNCQPEKCPAGQTGTPPNCQTPPPPPCSAGEHRHGNGGCDPDHEPPCGVGKWNPGHGHTLIDRPACTYADASHATGPITYCGTQSHTHKTRHFHYGGNGCHPTADAHPTGTTSTDPNDDEPKNGSSMTVSQIIEEFGSLLTCEWAADANDKLGLACDAITFATPVLISGVGGNTNEAEILRDAGAWAYCYRLRALPKRVTLACAGITIVVDPLTDAIKKLSNIGADRGRIQPPDPDQTDNDNDGPPPTGTTSPDDSDDKDPEPTPGICDRNSAPTNPYKIGPSNTTPQQWADWWAWFDCP